MSILIEKDEGTAARRRIPMRLFLSDGTSPDTGASNDSVIMGTNSATTFTPNAKLTAIHSAQGMYYLELGSSDVSVLGTHPLYHVQGDFCQHVNNIDIVNFNPYSSFSNIAAKTYSGVTVGSLATLVATQAVNVTQWDGSAVTTPLVAGVPKVDTIYWSDQLITTPGVAGTPEVNVTFWQDTAPNLLAGGKVDAILQPALYSGVTIAGLDTSGNQAVANSLLSTNVGNSRLVQEYLWPMRNKVQIAGSVMTVFKPDDATSSWTASLTTGTITITTMDPQG